MRRLILLALTLAVATIAAICFATHHQTVDAQQRAALTPEVIARRNSVEKELQTLAVVDRKLMISMRDGKRMAADVYRPKDASMRLDSVFDHCRSLVCHHIPL